MTIQLWPHQWDAITTAAEAVAADRKAGLWEIPTGGGKTVAFLTLARELGWTTLILVHRDELVRQTVDTASRLWPEARVGIVQGKLNEWRARDLVIASVQSLRGDRLLGMPTDHFGLIVADECHHVPSPSWSAVLQHFRPTFLLGVTATPDRLDGVGLADWFGPEPLYAYSLQQAIQDGGLVRLRQFAVNTDVILDDVSSRAGDFANGELARAVTTDARNRAVVEAYLTHASTRKTIVFAVNLAHVEQLTREFADASVRVRSVTGQMGLDERRRVLADFSSGACRVLVNCEVCTEGYDERTVDCVIMARPTQSRALYQQCVGRGLRICPEIDKRDCLILDITDNCRRHQLVSVFDLFGAGDLRDARGADVLEVVGREKQRRVKQLKELPWALNQVDRAPVSWDLEEVHPWPTLPDLDGYQPTQFWQGQPATRSQIRYLEGCRLFVRPGLTKGEAAHLISQCKRFEAELPLPATSRQEWLLRSRDQWHDGIRKDQATNLIAEIKLPA